MKGSSLRAARRACLAAVVTSLLASCTSQPVLLPSQDFNRPADVAFVCMETFSSTEAMRPDAGGVAPDGGAPVGDRVVSGRPMRDCHPRGAVDPTGGVIDSTGVGHHTFGFVPNSASGDMTVVNADNWSLVNLEPGNPNFNRLPIGALPSQISASDDGCRLVTANHGSCDLSVVDPAALMASTIAREEQVSVGAAGPPLTTSVVPILKHSGRPLRLFAGEISFLPMDTAALKGATALCSGDPGQQWQALATFPSCDLVALIDLPSGVIQKAAYARRTADGVALVPVPDGEDPVCPVSDCLYPPVDASAEAATDGGASDGGAPAGVTTDAAAAPAPPNTDPGDVPFVGQGALSPGPIAIEPQSGRAYVGLANAAYVLAFDVAPGQIGVSSGGGAIPLHEGALGVDSLRLSIDPYKDKTTSGGIAGSFVGNDTAPDREYLYVIARDGTLRVVQVSQQPETECETNVDFAAIADPTARAKAMSAACHPVVGAQGRLPGATGPGIRFPTPPVDIAAADIRPVSPDNSETSVYGAHAWVLTASGNVYLVNIDPVLRNIFYVQDADNDAVEMCTTPPAACYTEPPPAPNTVRNRSFLGYTAALDPSTGPPRLDFPPAQATIGPQIEPIWTRGTAANATAVTGDYIQTSVFFPDPSSAVPQTWSVTWEGNLLPTPRLTGQMVSNGSELDDPGMDFCRAGVLADDIVTFQGCTNTNQCGIGKVCVPGSNGSIGAGGLPITGLCLAPDLPPSDCEGLLSTVKRYDVTYAHQAALGLAPHKDELVRPTLQPCVATPKAGSGAAADAGVGADAGDGGADALASSMPADDCVDPEDPSTNGFACVAGRCLYPCTMPMQTAGCRAGRICVPFGADPTSCSDGQCFCADGPPLEDLKKRQAAFPLEACLGELLPYEVSAGRGFFVSGSVSPPPAVLGTEDSKGNCVALPGLDEREHFRIPMDAPVCTNIGKNPGDDSLDSRCDPNLVDPECPLTIPPGATATKVAQATAVALRDMFEPVTTSEPTPCFFIGGPNQTDPTEETPHHIRAMYRNREIEFMMTNLERPPSGAFQIRFDVHGGFQPQTVTIPTTVEVTMPTRLVLGPFDSTLQAGLPGSVTASEVPYLFVVDQRRLGRAQGGGPTRGQLLRIHPLGFAITTPVTGNQPWFEDLEHSNNLFPMQ